MCWKEETEQFFLGPSYLLVPAGLPFHPGLPPLDPLHPWHLASCCYRILCRGLDINMGIRTRENTAIQVVVKVLVTVTVYALFMWDAHCQDGTTIANKNTTNTSTVKLSEDPVNSIALAECHNFRTLGIT